MANNSKKNNSLKGKIIGVIFFTWFILSIVGMVVLGQINGYYFVMMFGQYFLVFGLIPLFDKDNSKWIGIPFLLVGLACIIIPFLMMHPEFFEGDVDWDKFLVILVMLAFIIVGLCMVFIPIFRFKYLRRVCSLKVCATVKSHKVTRSDKGRKLYAPVYEFEFNGKKYEVSKEEYTNINVLEKGAIVELKINPNNPDEFLDSENFSKAIIVLGILFLIVSVPIFYLIVVGKLL